MFMISAMSCGGTAANLSISNRRFDSLASQFSYNVKFFAIDYRASVDAGLARTKCFLFVKTFFIWQNTLFKQIHIACRLGKIGHYRRL